MVLVIIAAVLLTSATVVAILAHRAPIMAPDASRLDRLDWSALDNANASLRSSLERFPTDAWSDDPDRTTRRGYVTY